MNGPFGYLTPGTPEPPPYPYPIPQPPQYPPVTYAVPLYPTAIRHIGLEVHTDDADVTFARLRLPGDGLEVTGRSIRARGDKFDRQIGEWLSLARALRKMADRLERRARGRMRHIDEIRRHKAEIQAAKARNVNWPGLAAGLVSAGSILRSSFQFVPRTPGGGVGTFVRVSTGTPVVECWGGGGSATSEQVAEAKAELLPDGSINLTGTFDKPASVSTTDVRTRVELDNGKVVHVKHNGHIDVFDANGRHESFTDAS